MPSFSERSEKNLDTCAPDLIRLFLEVIKYYDCTIVCGHRGKDEQDEAFYNQKSTKLWPTSKHNKFPSRAVDVAPGKRDDKGKYYIDWEDEGLFKHFVSFVENIALQLGITVKNGGYWTHPKDYPHWELID